MRQKQLEVKALTLFYPLENGVKLVPKTPFDLTVYQGEKVLIQGGNGTGKSSILKILAGQYDGAIVDSGELLYYDNEQMYSKCPVSFPYCRYVSDKQVHAISAGLGNLFVSNIIASGFSRNQFFYQGEIDRSIQQKVDTVSKELKINFLLDRQLSTLSSGQKMLVLIARAFVCDPSFVILDEIEPYLDQEHRQLLIPFLKNTQKTVIASSHTLTDLYQSFRVKKITESNQTLNQSLVLSKKNQPIFKEDLVVLKDADYYRDDKWVLQSVDLVIKSASCYHVQGENGAGKSTLLDAISRKIYPVYKNDESGIFYPFLKNNVVTDKILDLQIGYSQSVSPEVTEDGKNYDYVKVIDYLWSHYEQIHPYLLDQSKPIPKRVCQIMSDYHLNDLMDRKIGEISSGERRRLEIAKAFMRKNKLILLDEPFNHLDHCYIGQLISAIVQTISKDGSAVIFTGHESVDLPVSFQKILVKDKKVLTLI